MDNWFWQDNGDNATAAEHRYQINFDSNDFRSHFAIVISSKKNVKFNPENLMEKSRKTLLTCRRSTKSRFEAFLHFVWSMICNERRKVSFGCRFNRSELIKYLTNHSQLDLSAQVWEISFSFADRSENEIVFRFGISISTNKLNFSTSHNVLVHLSQHSGLGNAYMFKNYCHFSVAFG